MASAESLAATRVVWCRTLLSSPVTSFESGEDHPDHPYHFDSPVEVFPFLKSLGLEAIAPNVWKKRSR